jgi:hypothetical protein
VLSPRNYLTWGHSRLLFLTWGHSRLLFLTWGHSRLLREQGASTSKVCSDGKRLSWTVTDDDSRGRCRWNRDVVWRACPRRRPNNTELEQKAQRKMDLWVKFRLLDSGAPHTPWAQ